MGILRADRVSGLGGANAINGSVRFNGNYLDIADVDTAFGTGGDWTMECWINPQEVALKAITDPRTSNSSVHPLLWISGGNGGKTVGVLYYYTSGADRIVGTTVLQSNTWYHVAVVRNSGTTHLYVNGTSEGSFSDTLDYASTPTFRIGQRYDGTPYNYDGYISNFRLINGTALYTANFTPPAQRLENISGTEILCCQSPGNVEQEATGKTITAPVPTNGAAAQASRFVPDKGEDYGTTFEDNTRFDTLSYMVPPGGTTAESNRGRALLMGGAVSPGSTNTTQIKYFDIASQGITDDFGQTSVARRATASLSSSTRAVMGGGFVSPPSPYTISDVMDYVTIATTANATDFGNMQSTGYSYGTASNETRGLFAGGYRPNNSAVVNTIDLITIATTGNASNFGDLTRTARSFGGAGSTTRGVFFGGTHPAIQDVIDYVTFSTTGDATDFGNLTDARDNAYGASSSTRAVMAGGRDPNTTNIIDYITIASTGDATDFGDLTQTSYYFNASTSNSIRAVWVGTSTIVNSMEFVTIATTGNSVDWGDQGGTIQHSGGACSDSHGGIS